MGRHFSPLALRFALNAALSATGVIPSRTASLLVAYVSLCWTYSRATPHEVAISAALLLSAAAKNSASVN